MSDDSVLSATVVEVLEKFSITCPLEDLEGVVNQINAALLPVLRQMVIENYDQLSVRGCVQFEGCDALITVQMPRELLLERIGVQKGE